MEIKTYVPDIKETPMFLFDYGVVAGSYPAYKIGNMKEFQDIDVFLYEVANEEILHAKMFEEYGKPLESTNSYRYFREPYPAISVMKKEKFTTTTDMWKLIRAFDIINIRCATDGKHIYYHKSCVPNRLEIAHPKELVCPLNTLFRLVKFAQRGYIIDYDGLVSVLFAIYKTGQLKSDGCFMEVK